jgi:phosphoribosylanthranilate isomerase
VRTRIKICGIRAVEHAQLAAREGADAIGLVFHAPSPRFVSVEAAAAISAALPPFVTAVGLFVDMPAEAVRSVLSRVPLDMLQFHGEESPEYCAAFGKPWLRAVRMSEGVDLVEWAHRFSRAKALLIDADVPGQAGGTGRTFDWGRVSRNLPLPIVLSGGLNAGNVGAAIRAVRPWAVDVSSGVESGRGVKDPARIVEFIRSARLEAL